MLRGGGMPVVVGESVGFEIVGSLLLVEVGDVDIESLESYSKSEVSKCGLWESINSRQS